MDRDGFPSEECRVRRGDMSLEEDFAVPDEVKGVPLNDNGEITMHC